MHTVSSDTFEILQASIYGTDVVPPAESLEVSVDCCPMLPIDFPSETRDSSCREVSPFNINENNLPTIMLQDFHNAF